MRKIIRILTLSDSPRGAINKDRSSGEIFSKRKTATYLVLKISKFYPCTFVKGNLSPPPLSYSPLRTLLSNLCSSSHSHFFCLSSVLSSANDFSVAYTHRIFLSWHTHLPSSINQSPPSCHRGNV